MTKMAQNDPRMTQNDPKWPKMTQNYPKWPKNDAWIYALFPQFFFAFRMYATMCNRLKRQKRQKIENNLLMTYLNLTEYVDKYLPVIELQIRV